MCSDTFYIKKRAPRSSRSALAFMCSSIHEKFWMSIQFAHEFWKNVSREDIVQDFFYLSRTSVRLGAWYWSAKLTYSIQNYCVKKIKKPLYKLRKIVYSLNIKNWIQRGGQGCHDNHGIRAHFFKRQRWRLCFEESDRKTRPPAESRVRRERDNREHSGAGWLRATLDTPPAAAGRSSRDCALSSERVKRKTIVSF